MNTVRAKALKARIAGKSYNEIQKEFGVPKSTLSGWLKHVVLSDTAQARIASRARLGSAILIKRNKMQTQKAEQRARETRASAKEEIPTLVKRDLLILGTVLYWAEGYKRLHIRDGKERMSHTISFVNSDPAMIKAFLRFLREVLSVSADAIHLTMRLYPHINEEQARTYWIGITKLPRIRFRPTTNMVSIASKGKRPYNRLPYGTLQVAVYDTAKFHYLLGLIEGVQARM
ncbi:MAG TPA: hypothetical protein PLW99_02755 [Candidatus Paceibacterota bacterium]|nr:MAG: hypothetical protein B7X03_02445 [Parcubacteria group bacterium 21-58-10]HQT83042.1 hypothetical protein [Candidatus Paceibacterota bacterium]